MARLLDDHEALAWLRYEISGYPIDELSPEAQEAAVRSNRQAPNSKIWTGSLAHLSTEANAAEAQLQAGCEGGSQGEWRLAVEISKKQERSGLREIVTQRRELTQRIVGAIHDYVAERYQELRFGSAVESAFEVVRAQVDADIAAVVPDALPMLAAAFENAASDNPEHWAAAGATCRRLLKEIADVLRPPGPDIEAEAGKTIKMGPHSYINRLVAWIVEQSESGTATKLTQAELEFLGHRPGRC